MIEMLHLFGLKKAIYDKNDFCDINLKLATARDRIFSQI